MYALWMDGCRFDLFLCHVITPSCLSPWDSQRGLMCESKCAALFLRLVYASRLHIPTLCSSASATALSWFSLSVCCPILAMRASISVFLCHSSTSCTASLAFKSSTWKRKAQKTPQHFRHLVVWTHFGVHSASVWPVRRSTAVSAARSLISPSSGSALCASSPADFHTASWTPGNSLGWCSWSAFHSAGTWRSPERGGRDDVSADVKVGYHPWSFAITHLIDTSVGIRDELADGCPHVWLQRMNTHTEIYGLNTPAAFR